MSKEKSAISVFQKYLTVWVILCMVIGVLIGKFLPQIPDFLNRFEYAKVSIPMAILIWLMIYPMMMKVDFQSIKNVGKNPKGLFVTWITNWLIKPFTMYGIASLFFFVIFKAFITPDLATEYLAGAVLLGAAPCTAMVFVWSSLTKGDPAYTVVQVATNDLIILVAFIPIVKFLLGVSNVSVPWDTLILSVILFVVIPLAGGMLTRYFVTKKKGKEYFENTFVKKFDGITTIGLLLTLINNRGHVLTRAQLLEHIWDVAGDFVNDNTLTVYIKRLREKLEADPQTPCIIKTVRGVGYKID